MVYIVIAMEHMAKLNCPYTKFDQNLYNNFGNDTFKKTRPLLYTGLLKMIVMVLTTFHIQ
jgi:hypothetical protein